VTVKFLYEQRKKEEDEMNTAYWEGGRANAGNRKGKQGAEKG